MGELKALKMIQAKNYKHLTFDIDTGESRKTGHTSFTGRCLYRCVCVCVCALLGDAFINVCVWGGRCPSQLESVQRREHWLGEWSMLLKKRGGQGPSREREIEN